MTRVSLCSTKGCPTRLKGFKGDVNDWHVPWCGHGLEGHHHHVKKRSQGGTKGDIVFICPDCHQRIDEHHWGNAVLDIPEIGRVYRVWDQNNRTVFERIVEAAPEESDPDEGLELRPEIEERLRQSKLTVREPTLPDVQYHATGLQLPENLTREQWEKIAGTIQQMIVSAPWWVGDVLVYGQRYGEEMWQAIKERGGADYERLRKYMWVSERVPFGTRVPALKWSHHREVADLEPDEQKAWLQRAQDEGMAVNELRLAIKGDEPPDVCPDTANGEHDYRRVCRHCGKER